MRKEVIGDCVLYLADCLAVLPTLEAGSVDAVVTDPPYGLGNTAARARPSNYQRSAGMTPREWDKVPADLAGIHNLAPTAAIWGGNYFSLPASRGWLTWFKPDAPPSMASVEFAWTNLDQNARQISCSIAATNAERVGHPTQKPLAVMLWTLEQIDAGELVLDPFMGSGTTGVACVRLGRKFIGIEKEEKYFDIACRRIQKAWDEERTSLLTTAAKVEQATLFE